MSRFLSRAVVLLVLCGLLGLAFTFFPSVSEIHFQIHSWGWLAFGVTIVGVQIVFNYVRWFVREFFKLPGMDFAGRPICGVAAKIFGCLCMAGVFLTLSKFMPAEYFSIGAPTGLYIMFGGWGLTFGIWDEIERRFFPTAQ